MSNRDYNIILGILVTIACIIASILFYVVYRGSQEVDVSPTPPPELPDEAWLRIKTTGVMRAGTAADYPPFAFRLSESTLDGLDVAIIKEIGRRLGITVDLRDMAFDQLSWALEQDQIDVAIAALSITPERSERINFSEPYFISEDAALAKEGANIQDMLTVEDMAPFRIGVEKSTVFSNWLHERLVDTGLISPSQLVEYEEISSAVADLRQGRIDLVILDLQPAEVAVSQGGVELVAQGLHIQQFGIGIPKDEPTLLAQINMVLASMKNDGTLADLTRQYTGVEVPGPTPTTSATPPTSTPVVSVTPAITTTPGACVDGMTFVEDLNLKTPQTFMSGTQFRKGWRIKNTGTCIWDQRYRLAFDGGNTLAGKDTPIQGQVPPGAFYDIYVDMVAPNLPGTYQSFWKMSNNLNQKFGDRVWVIINVEASTLTPTVKPSPTVTLTPSPDISFTVDRTQINEGECVTFRWTVTNARSVYFYEQGQSWQQNPVQLVGSSLECPSTTTVYELRVIKFDGTTEIRQITILVQARPNAPVIELFTIDPPAQIPIGQCVDITWRVTGTVTRVVIRRDSAVLLSNAPASGTREDCPQAPGLVNYIIEAEGPGGTNIRQQAITVTELPPPTLIPPQIVSFTLDPQQIQTNECTLVSWQVTGDVTRVQLTRDGGVLLEDAPVDGSRSDCSLGEGSYVYRLDVLGENGETKVSERTLTVFDVPVVPPLEGTNWTLEGIMNSTGDLVPPIEDTLITAVFGVDDNMSGESGCNQYATSYSVDGNSNSISIGLPGVGISFCSDPSGVMDQEARYLELLPQSVFYDLSSGFLTFSDANGRLILRFVEP